MAKISHFAGNFLPVFGTPVERHYSLITLSAGPQPNLEQLAAVVRVSDSAKFRRPARTGRHGTVRTHPIRRKQFDIRGKSALVPAMHGGSCARKRFPCQSLL